MDAELLAETPKGRTFLRQCAGLPSSDRTPIHLVAGDASPELIGRGFYWTTPGGKPIYYPNAYKWRKVYHHSTWAIRVGKEWIAANQTLAA